VGVDVERRRCVAVADAFRHVRRRDASGQQCGRLVVVGSDRGAVSAFRLIRFLGPSSEPDVRLPPHPALHRFMSCGCSDGRCPWRHVEDLPPVAGPGDGHGAGIEHLGVTLGGPPPGEVAASEPFPGCVGMLVA
jgi:hypothetical protein